MSHLVLIVDDAREVRRFYRDFLIHRGYRAITAGNGALAVRYAIRFRPDLIVMDLAMPGMDGIEATRVLRSHKRTRAIPIVAVTGYAWRTVARIAAQMGFAAFVSKPCGSLDLVATVDQVLQGRPATTSGS